MCVCESVFNGAGSQGQVVMERSCFLQLIGPDERSDRGRDTLLHASRNNLASSRVCLRACVCLCVCVWTEERKKDTKGSENRRVMWIHLLLTPPSW